MGKRILSETEKNIAKQFGEIFNNGFVAIDGNTTPGHILMSVLNENSELESSFLAQGTTDVQKAYRQKYEEKLLKAAKKKGFKDIDDLLEEEAKKKKQEISINNIQLNSKQVVEPAASEKSLPSSCKSLDQILNLDLIRDESAEKIGKFWNMYHASKDGYLSASLDFDFYEKLYKKSIQVPMFILPLPREEGYEMIFIQFQGHQVFFTQLAEYQLKKEGAKPFLSVSFYCDIAKEKDIVLMLGELSNSNGPVNAKDAQNLIYQLQLFYVNGNEIQKGLVDKFWKNPAEFNHLHLIDSLLPS